MQLVSYVPKRLVALYMSLLPLMRAAPTNTADLAPWPHFLSLLLDLYRCLYIMIDVACHNVI